MPEEPDEPTSADSDREAGERPETEEERKARIAAEELYTKGVLTRGEAAEPDEEGKLPPGATHEIVKDGEDTGEGTDADEGGNPKIRRRRFSIT